MRLWQNPTPVLILRGECDYISPQVARQYESTFANTLIEVRGAGHLVSLERPDIYTGAVRAFLRGQPLPEEGR